jgi:hypothetical protein
MTLILERPHRRWGKNFEKMKWVGEQTIFVRCAFAEQLKTRRVDDATTHWKPLPVAVQERKYDDGYVAAIMYGPVRLCMSSANVNGIHVSVDTLLLGYNGIAYARVRYPILGSTGEIRAVGTDGVSGFAFLRFPPADAIRWRYDHLQEAARAALTFIWMRKQTAERCVLHWVPKDVVLVIAKLVHASWGDECWLPLREK